MRNAAKIRRERILTHEVRREAVKTKDGFYQKLTKKRSL
jgi:hypothetical protein